MERPESVALGLEPELHFRCMKFGVLTFIIVPT